MSLSLVVLLSVDPVHEGDYEHYEAVASQIMARYGGRIERRITFAADDTATPADRPDEVHIVTFPSEERFEAYRADADLEALAEVRARVIKRTQIWRGEDLPLPASARSASTEGFDFDGFARAVRALDAEAWLSYFDDEAEWVEYKHSRPPSAPRLIRGKEEISAFLGRIAGGGIEVELGDEIVGPERAAFCLWVTLPDQRRIVENVIIHFRNGRIVRQVDVEAWDPET